MFECQICGLLSLGGSACPACGSQLRKDLSAEMDGDEVLPTEVPGLDDAADAWYDLEGIEPPAEETREETTPTSESQSTGLPFGFQGESKVFAPRLPFGIGSFAEGIPFDAGATANRATLPESKENDQPDTQTEAKPAAPPPSTPSEHTDERTSGHEMNEVSPAVGVAKPAVAEVSHVQSPTEVIPTTSTAPSSPVEAASGSPEAEVPEMPPLDVADDGHDEQPLSPSQEFPAPPPPPSSHEVPPVRLQTARLVQPAPSPEPVTEVIPADASAPSDGSDVPDYWRIDAAIPNYEEIYDHEDDVVEVEYGSVSEDVVVYDHATDSPAAVFHSPLEASPVNMTAPTISLSLHPVQALNVDVGGDADLSTALSEGFTMMQQGAWSQAARIFQRMAASLPGNPEVFNNYGISLLQRAIGMRDGNDIEQRSLADPQFESAILALREAAKNAPTNGDILINLAAALVESGRSEKALGIMNVHNARSPGSTKGLNTAAVAMFNLGQLTQATETLQQVHEDPVAQSNLAQLAPAQSR